MYVCHFTTEYPLLHPQGANHACSFTSSSRLKAVGHVQPEPELAEAAALRHAMLASGILQGMCIYYIQYIIYIYNF